MQITPAGWKILNHRGLGKLIDAALAEPYCGSDLAPAVISRLYDDLIKLAKETSLPVEAFFGLIEAYVEEVNDKRGT